MIIFRVLTLILPIFVFMAGHAMAPKESGSFDLSKYLQGLGINEEERAKLHSVIKKDSIPTVDQLRAEFEGEFEKEKITIFAEFTRLGLSKKEIDDAVEAVNSEKEKIKLSSCQLEALDPRIHSIIAATCQDFGVDAQKLCIYQTDKKLLGATATTLYINESLVKDLIMSSKNFPGNFFFAIGHELQHYIYKDGSVLEALGLLFKDKQLPCDLNDETHPINRLSRLFELRADVLAALKNEEYVKRFHAWIKEATFWKNTKKIPGHLAAFDRLKKAAELMKKLGLTA